MAQSVFELVGRILIDNADALEKISDTTEQAKGLADALNGTGESADNTGKKLGSTSKFGAGSVFFGNMMTKLTDWSINLGKVIGKTGFGYNSMMESYATSFKVLIGDEEKALQLLDDLWKLAADTPMEMTGLAKNAQDLLNYGMAVEEIIPTLNMLGDASLGNQKKMDGISYALGQIKAYGALRGQESMQMIENGFPILEFLEKTMGNTKEELLSMREKGEISYDDVLEAVRYATTDDRYKGSMDEFLKTYEGQKAKLSDASTQSIGTFTESFFEMAKSDVLPRLTESFEKFGTWATENKDTISKMAESLGKFSTITFDGALNFFKWMTENGDAVAAAIGVIGTAMGVAAVTAHPYATAVAAIASAIMLLKSEAGQKRGTYDHMFDGYSEADIEVLNRYVDAMNAVKAAEDAALNDATGNSWGKYDEAVTAEKAALEELLAIENLYQTYNTWHQAQAGYAGANGPALNVELQIADDAESVVQSDIDGMNFSATVKMYPDTSALNRSYSYITGVDGSHANGLDYVPHDGYIARLHQGESVLTRQEASVWRNGTGGGFDVDALARRFASSVASAMSGMALSFDKGATVGQLLPAIDTGLGTTSTRKGRRN